jgi:hypothetical protein
MKFIKSYNATLKEQYIHFKDAVKHEHLGRSATLFKLMQQIFMFVPTPEPNPGQDVHSSNEKIDTYIKHIQRDDLTDLNMLSTITNPFDGDKNDNGRKELIRRCTKHFIFCGQDASRGTDLVREGLLCLGFEDCFPQVDGDNQQVTYKYRAPSLPFNGFVMLPDGSEQDLAERAQKLFNLPQNRYGRLCRILVAGKKYTEGVNLFNVRAVHLFNQTESISKEQQAIARAVRFCGHKYIPQNQWKVEVLRYFAYVKGNDNQTEYLADMEAYKYSRVMKSVFESYLNPVRLAAIDNNFYNNTASDPEK